MLKNKKYLTAAAVLVLIIAAAVFYVGVGVNLRNANAQKEVEQASQPLNEAVGNEAASQDIKNEDKPLAEEIKSEPKKPEIIQYSVKEGDNLGAISEKYGVSIDTIAKSNGISENDVIREGQQLRFPSVNGILYKIKNGETIWDLSFTYDVNITDIVEANTFESPDKLKIGQEIIIPGADKIMVAKTESKLASNSVAKSNSINSESQKNANPAGIKIASRGASGSLQIASLNDIIWPVKGRVTSGFGSRGSEFHKGIDIAAPVGTPIYAAIDGRVIYSGTMNGFGNIVILSHGNGLETYYGHNSKNLVSVGQSVKKGSKIAELGNTGRSTGPHVEFGIRKNGNPVNPSLYLK